MKFSTIEQGEQNSIVKYNKKANGFCEKGRKVKKQ